MTSPWAPIAFSILLAMSAEANNPPKKPNCAEILAPQPSPELKAILPPIQSLWERANQLFTKHQIPLGTMQALSLPPHVETHWDFAALHEALTQIRSVLTPELRHGVEEQFALWLQEQSPKNKKDHNNLNRMLRVAPQPMLVLAGSNRVTLHAPTPSRPLQWTALDADSTGARKTLLTRDPKNGQFSPWTLDRGRVADFGITSQEVPSLLTLATLKLQNLWNHKKGHIAFRVSDAQISADGRVGISTAESSSAAFFWRLDEPRPRHPQLLLPPPKRATVVRAALAPDGETVALLTLPPSRGQTHHEYINQPMEVILWKTQIEQFIHWGSIPAVWRSGSTPQPSDFQLWFSPDSKDLVVRAKDHMRYDRLLSTWLGPVDPKKGTPHFFNSLERALHAWDFSPTGWAGLFSEDGDGDQENDLVSVFQQNGTEKSWIRAPVEPNDLARFQLVLRSCGTTLPQTSLLLISPHGEIWELFQKQWAKIAESVPAFESDHWILNSQWNNQTESLFLTVKAAGIYEWKLPCPEEN